MVEEAERLNPVKPTREGMERSTVEVTVTMTWVPRAFVAFRASVSLVQVVTAP